MLAGVFFLFACVGARADSFIVDVTDTGVKMKCGDETLPLKRVCIAVTNDDQNESPFDNDRCIKSFFIEVRPQHQCPARLRGASKAPDGWDPDGDTVLLRSAGRSDHPAHGDRCR